MTAAIEAAVELKLFSAIAAGNSTPEQLAAACGASKRGVRILADFLTVGGLLRKSGDRYSLSEDSAVFLDEKSPAYLGGTVRFLLSPMLKQSFENLAETVRKGRSPLPGEGSVEPDNPVWQDFARAMAPMMMMPAKAIAAAAGTGPMQVLDVAAGHGLFGISIAKSNPEARVTALDWAGVLEVARENAAAAGVQGQMSYLPGDAFEVDLGGPYDLALLTNFLHHFDPLTCVKVLKKIHAALKPGGRAITLEFVPNSDRVSPPVPANFALVMLATTVSGDAYTFEELNAMFREAGFSKSSMQDVPENPERIVVSHK